MRVLSICEYLTAGDRSPAHWDPYCVTNALKGRPFSGYANLTIGGASYRIDSANTDPVFPWAAERLAPQIIAACSGEVTLVPIPGHACVRSADVMAHRLYRLVTATANWMNARGVAVPRAHVRAVLHFDSVQESAHAGGGTRDPKEVLSHYKSGILDRAGLRGKVVLVDDVVTTGARMVAAEHYLRSCKVDVLDLGFAVARTVHAKGEAFGVHVETYPPIV